MRACEAYLSPHEQSFWRWSADGKAVEWRDGRTIAFRAELAAVLDRLVQRGLPPLSAVLMVLAATRDSWTAGDNAIAISAPYGAIRSIPTQAKAQIGGHQFVGSIVNRKVDEEARLLCEDLQSIADLPESIRHSNFGRITLVEFVLADAHAEIGALESPQVLEVLLRSDRPVNDAAVEGDDRNFNKFVRDMEILRLALPRVTLESAELFLQTGMADLPAAAEFEIPISRRVREMIRELSDDSELGGVARMARDALAALHLPRLLRPEQEQPVGGVSDISNRGPLDRLLVSELANDDLTLAVRVATGEALYLRRESPQQHPQQGRAVLVDNTIRLWGEKRVIATSIAMALLASVEDRDAGLAYRPRGMSVEPADLISREGLLAHLSTSEPSPDPGSSLAALVEQLDMRDAQGEAITEIYIVTSAAAADDPAFVRRLQTAYLERECFLLKIDDDHQVQVIAVSAAGRRMISSFRLPFASATPAAKRTPLTSPIDSTLPFIFSLERFPMLLSGHLNAKNAISGDFGVIGVTHDRRLMHWFMVGRGGMQLADRLPIGRVEAIYYTHLDQVVAVFSHRKTSSLTTLTVNLETGKQDRHAFKLDVVEAISMPEHEVLIVADQQIRAIDPIVGTCRTLSRIDPRHKYVGGRYFHDGISVFSFSSSGFVTVVPAAHKTIGRHPGEIIGAADCPGDGPLLVLQSGDIVFRGNLIQAIRPLAGSSLLKLAAASYDGKRLLGIWKTPAVNEPEACLLDVEATPIAWRKAHASVADGVAHRQLIGKSHKQLTCFYPEGHSKIDAVDIIDGRVLVRSNSRFHEFRIGNNDQLQLLRDVANQLSVGTRSRVAHMVPYRVPPLGYRLSVARWPDGSAVWMDSRGLLHFVSADKRVPEFSLTLHGWINGGWTSDGRTFGAPSFFENPTTDSTAHGISLLGEFARRLR